MKDYGKTWDYENGEYLTETESVMKIDLRNGKLVSWEQKPRIFPRFRKVANQYGVAKFVRVN
jgi:hypothetical protein